MLFGHQNDTNQASAPATAPSIGMPQDSASNGMNPLAVDPATGVSLPVSSADTVASIDPTQDEPSVLNQPAMPSYDTQPAFVSDPAPTTPFGSDQASAPSLDNTLIPPAPPTDTSIVDPAATSIDLSNLAVTLPQSGSIAQLRLSTAPTDTLSTSNDDLLSIKQQALSQLGPLVSQLEQDPEEKFRTTMMLIQSTDNAALLKGAYDAAQSIPDEKIRAQALLDIVNEINYFTQRTQNTESQ